MIRNYLVAGVRSLSRHKVSFLINLLGLTLGLTVCAIIGLYLDHELGFDKFHKNEDRIFRVVHDETAGEIPGNRRVANVGPPVGPALKERFTQVEDAVRFRYTPDHIIAHKGELHYESRIFYVDPSIFQVFTFPLLAGDEKTALSKPNSVVITEEMAKKYFGDENPVGRVLTMDRDTPLEVTGVLAGLPTNAHLRFDFLLPFEMFRVPEGYPVTLESWGWISFHTYVLLKPMQDYKALEASLPSTLVADHWNEERAKRFKMRLQPLSEIYLGDFRHETVAAGNKTYLFVLATAAALILIVAGFNFANLFTVLSTARAREIGVRKVVGARNPALSFQITGQAIVIVLLASLATALILPLLTRTMTSWGLPLDEDLSTIGLAVLCITGAAILIGVVSSIYPAYYLSNNHYEALLKGSFKQSRKGISIRNGMIGLQFVISIALIVSVLVIHTQMTYLREKDLGYASNELLLLRIPGEHLRSKFPFLKNELLKNPNVTNVSVGGGRMDGDNGNVPIIGEGQNDDQSQPMAIDAVTFDFFKTIGITPVSGREFTESMPADTLRGVIINVSAARSLGWDETTAPGKRIRVGDIVHDGEVIGVVPDFHFGSLHGEIAPLVIYYPRTRLQDVYVRFSSNELRELISSVERNWRAVVPELPFEYRLMNDHLAGLYRSEQFFDLLFRFFATVAILVSCLGLYGVINQDISYRLKELGIRKVLGAGTGRVFALLVAPMARLVVVANLASWPIAWIMMARWLDEFPYRTFLDWRVFPVAGVLALIAAAIATCTSAYKAASTNPVDSLRNE